MYSDIVNDPGNTHLIEDELSMFFNIDVLSHNEYVLLLILKNIIVDSRKIICGKDSDKLYEIQEINADLLYLIVKLLLQKATEELSNFTVRCSLIENATNINIDSKTNTRLFKKSFLHRIFTVTDTLPQNVSLPIRVIFAPIQFSSLKTINISPYKNIYDCPDINKDARFIMLKSVSDNETAQFMMERMNESYKAKVIPTRQLLQITPMAILQLISIHFIQNITTPTRRFFLTWIKSVQNQNSIQIK